MSASDFSAEEMMNVVAARELQPGTVCFVGVGPPSLAANIARRTHAPDLVLVYESGTIGSKPVRLPLSIGDGELAETADSVVSVPEIFNYWVQPGRLEVAFLGAAQIDRFGNINTTVIGDYEHPKVRLPGAGGAPEIAATSQKVIVMLRHSPRAFVEELDFVTSVCRPGAVITDLGVLRPRGENGELTLVALHPGVEADQVREKTAWQLEVADRLEVSEPPSAEELRVLRELKASVERRVGAPS